MIIGSAAHLIVCHDCGSHGRIRLADGRNGPEVCGKDTALASMQAAIGFGWITNAEVPELKRQIQASSLVEKAEDAALYGHLVTALSNSMRWQEDTDNMPPDATVH